MINLTNRMKNWIENLGVHIAVASKDGYPSVIVTEKSLVEGNIISVYLTPYQIRQIEKNIAENPYVAIAPGSLGAVRVPYQFKGAAKLYGKKLAIIVDEVYCTKPGWEAGLRVDTLGNEEMKKFDESRWQDMIPSV